MTPTEKTIAYLRNLTFDGYLSSEEVWALAGFLNRNPDCQASWPGDVLSPLLGDAFADGELSAGEMRELAAAIAMIEEDWVERVVESDREEGAVDTSALFIGKPEMPSVPTQVPVEGRQGTRFLVDLDQHKCSCPDWPARAIWPTGHPGRCCKHVAFAFARTGKVLQPWFQALIDDCFEHGRGSPPRADWVLLEFGGGKPALVSFEKDSDWCNVFAPGGEGYDHFGYHPNTRRWSFGAAPRNAAPIEWIIQQKAQGHEPAGA